MGLTDKIFKPAVFELETNSDGNVDTVKGDCLYRLVTGGFELIYKEEGSETRVKLTAENVEFERKGELSYKMLILPQQTTSTVMNTAYGKMELSVKGEDMLYMPMQHGFDAVFRYSLMNGSGGSTHMTIALRVKYNRQK